jgi:hypothetical protein
MRAVLHQALGCECPRLEDCGRLLAPDDGA